MSADRERDTRPGGSAIKKGKKTNQEVLLNWIVAKRDERCVCRGERARGRNASTVKGPSGEVGLRRRLPATDQRERLNIPHDLQITPAHMYEGERKGNQETTFRCRPRNHEIVKSHRRMRRPASYAWCHRHFVYYTLCIYYTWYTIIFGLFSKHNIAKFIF